MLYICYKNEDVSIMWVGNSGKVFLRNVAYKLQSKDAHKICVLKAYVQSKFWYK